MQQSDRDVLRYYRRCAGWYDFLFARFYRGLRERSIAGLGSCRSDRVLVIGVGTGLDLPLLRDVEQVVGVDLVRAMLTKAAHRHSAGRTDLLVANAAMLPLADAVFDAVVLHLVVSVATDPEALLAEAVRVVKVGGQITILDQLAPEGPVSGLRRAASRMFGILGARFDRQLGPLLSGQPLRADSDEPAKLGMYRVVRLTRTDRPPSS